MLRWPKFSVLVLLSGTLMVIGSCPQLWAAASSSLDVLPTDRTVDGSDSVDIGSLKPVVRPNRPPTPAPRTGNPLWSVPLSTLTATVARPIFSASRRPPQPAVIAPPAEVAIKPPPPSAMPDHPALALIGAVVGDGEAIGVFLDRATQKIVRLRKGETHAGWHLSAVQGREVTLQKAGRSEVLVLQRSDGPATPSAGGPVLPPRPAAGVPPRSVAGVLDNSYAPFTPRSTPKNGEPDGL